MMANPMPCKLLRQLSLLASSRAFDRPFSNTTPRTTIIIPARIIHFHFLIFMNSPPVQMFSLHFSPNAPGQT